MGRKLAGSLMKEQGLVSCQPLTLRYRHGSHELVAILMDLPLYFQTPVIT